MLDATERKCGIQLIYLMISYCELFQSILVHPPSLFSSLSLSLSLSFLVETLLPFYLPVTLSVLPPPLPYSHLSLFLLPSLSLSLSFFLSLSLIFAPSFLLSLSLLLPVSLFILLLPLNYPIHLSVPKVFAHTRPYGGNLLYGG